MTGFVGLTTFLQDVFVEGIRERHGLVPIHIQILQKMFLLLRVLVLREVVHLVCIQNGCECLFGQIFGSE